MPKNPPRNARRGKTPRAPEAAAEAVSEGAPEVAEPLAKRRGDRRANRPDARRILDRYRLDEQIALGGMAEVWRAEDETLGREVAVKLLHQHLLPDEASRHRFEVEARAAASLSHPGIVSVYDVAVSEDEAAIVMEFVPGQGLNRVLTERGRLPETEALEIAAQVGEALDHAHRRGVIHRDVKPDNILVDEESHARLVDFGIARVASDTAQRLTLAGTTLGTLRYMAPEQLAGEPGDERTDVFGLGATLYQMLAGRPPFDADAPAMLMRQQRARPTAISGIPGGVMNGVWDALDPEPAHRPQSAGEFAGRLRRLLGQEPAAEDVDAAVGSDTAVRGGAWAEPAPSGFPAAVVPPASAAGPLAARPAGVESAAVRDAHSAAPAPWSPQETNPPAWRAEPARSEERARRDARARRSSRGGIGWSALRGLPIGPIALLLVALLIVAAVVASGRFGQVAGGGTGNAQRRSSQAVADARVALRGNFQAGAGRDGTLPVGEQGTTLYRSLIRFNPDWSGMRRVVRIQLQLRTTGDVRVNRGRSPSTIVRRNVSGSWSEGDASDLTSRNAVTWSSKPQTNADGEARFDGPAGENQAITIDVTRLYLPLAPRALGGQGAQNLGITLLASSDDDSGASPNDTNEFWSREAGERGPRLIITYEGV
jgi:tRNA A-37 threonylcarbamoyl transferase component Bud32